MTLKKSKNLLKNNMAYFETSCVTREGIEKGFSYFVNELYEKLEKKRKKKLIIILKLKIIKYKNI